MRLLYFVVFLILLCELPYSYLVAGNGSNKNAVIDDVIDIKDFKKVLRTKTNVLVCFMSNIKESFHVIKSFKEAAVVVKGQGTMMLVDCSGEAKKMCKKLKLNPEPYVLKHYKDGEFHKDYDRKETVSSFVNFMRDPTGDLPWEEDSAASDVTHLSDIGALNKLIKKETKPLLIMFYAPWCSFCKSLKPEYAKAASELYGEATLAAIDVNRPENAAVRAKFNISEFPTLTYYLSGERKHYYSGENTKDAIITFMRNPDVPPVKIKEPEWSDTDSEIVHLTASSFDPVIKEEVSLLVMFYAPWCGHCKKMKPEYEKAAATLKQEGISGMLAAVDATKDQMIASRYSVKGYPTVKYFSYGEFKFDINVREASKIVDFMKNPQEPPPPPPAEVLWSEEKSHVVHLNEETFKPFLKKKKHVLVMFYAPWCGHCKKAKPEFTEAAEVFQDDPKVEYAAVDCTIQQTICSAQDVKGYPTIKYFSYYSKTVKTYSGGRSKDDFVKFMKDPDGLPSSSSPPAVANQKNLDSSGATNVLTLLDGTFKAAITANSPILVMFHAPWCGHCKKMLPNFSKAADELKSEGFKGRLATLDSTQNPDITEKYEISGFPTLKLFVNGKYVKDYEGDRSSDDLKRFIKSSSGKDEL